MRLARLELILAFDRSKPYFFNGLNLPVRSYTELIYTSSDFADGESAHSLYSEEENTQKTQTSMRLARLEPVILAFGRSKPYAPRHLAGHCVPSHALFFF